MKSGRLCVTSKEISIVTGKGIRYGQDLLKKMKSHYNKKKHQFITYHEFSVYSGIPLQLIIDTLR